MSGYTKADERNFYSPTLPSGKPKIAPVQGFGPGIPWHMHLRAYDAYQRKYSHQLALIDLEGRGCRGGFGTQELDDFIPGWREELATPIPMVLHCPVCQLQHIDVPDERTPEWTNPPHKSHLCHGCGCIWRPADVPTVGVEAIATRGKADTWPRDSGSDAERGDAFAAPSVGSQSGTRDSAGIAQPGPVL